MKSRKWEADATKQSNPNMGKIELMQDSLCNWHGSGDLGIAGVEIKMQYEPGMDVLKLTYDVPRQDEN